MAETLSSQNGKVPRPEIPVDNLIYQTTEYCVWLDEKLDVWWDTEECFESKMIELEGRAEWGEIMSRLTELEAFPISHLSEESRRGFKFQAGNGILLLFTEKFDHAKKMMISAETFYRIRTAEQARSWILYAGLLAAMSFTAAACVTGWIGKVTVMKPENLFEEIMLGSLVGTWGAFVSLIARASVLGIDATAGKRLHFLETTCRIVTGFIAGGIAVSAVEAGIIAPAIIKAGASSIVIVGFTAGFSERFLPSLIGRVDTSLKGNSSLPKR